MSNFMFIFLYLQAYCEAHCSNLAVFRDENDLRQVIDFMKHDDYISRKTISYILLSEFFKNSVVIYNFLNDAMKIDECIILMITIL